MSSASQAPYLPLSRDYRVLSSESTSEGLRVSVEVLGERTECPYCQGREIGKWSKRSMVCLDLPFKGQPAAFHVEIKRYRCKRCERSFSQSLPEISETRAMTQRLLLWIGQEGQVRTFISIAEDIGADEKTVRNAFGDFVKMLEEAVHIKTPTHMAILEITALHKPRVAVLNVQARTLVELLAKPNKITLHGYLGGLQDARDVRFASVGLSATVHEAASHNLPQALVFIDKPHVMALAASGLLLARDGLRAKVSKAILLKAHSALSPAEAGKLAEAFASCPVLGEVYRVKEALQAVYSEALAPELARARIEALLSGLSSEARPWLSGLTDAWAQWEGPMLNYFKPGAGEASIDHLGDLSSIGRAVDAFGRGYAFEAVRCKLLFPPRIPMFSFTGRGLSLQSLLAKSAD